MMRAVAASSFLLCLALLPACAAKKTNKVVESDTGTLGSFGNPGASPAGTCARERQATTSNGEDEALACNECLGARPELDKVFEDCRAQTGCDKTNAAFAHVGEAEPSTQLTITCCVALLECFGGIYGSASAPRSQAEVLTAAEQCRTGAGKDVVDAFSSVFSSVQQYCSAPEQCNLPKKGIAGDGDCPTNAGVNSCGTCTCFYGFNASSDGESCVSVVCGAGKEPKPAKDVPGCKFAYCCG